MTVFELAQDFFARLNQDPAATKYLEYDGTLFLRTPEECVRVKVDKGRIQSVESGQGSAGYWDFEIEGEDEIIRAILQARLTPGTAMWHGKIFMPEEKSKHNMAVAYFQAIRTAQENAFRPTQLCLDS